MSVSQEGEEVAEGWGEEVVEVGFREEFEDRGFAGLG